MVRVDLAEQAVQLLGETRQVAYETYHEACAGGDSDPPDLSMVPNNGGDVDVDDDHDDHDHGERWEMDV